MSYLPTILAAAAIFFLFVPIATFCFLLYIAKHAPFKVQTLRIGQEDELSDTFRRIAEPLAKRLEEFGWTRGPVVLGTAIQEREGSTEGWFFRKPGESTQAYLGWARGGFTAPAVRFVTPFLGGVTMSTTSGHPLHELCDHGLLGVQRIASREPEQLFEHHRDRVAEALTKGLVAEDLSPQGMCERMRTDQIRSANGLISRGHARKGKDASFHLGWRFGARHALRMVTRRKEIIKTEVPSGLSPQERAALRTWRPDNPSGPISEAAIESPVQSGKTGIWSLVSLAAFAVAMGFWVGWEALPALLAVLLIHEGGHVVAMRMFKFRDVNVFFIPFLGALATGNGKPWGLAPWKSAIVSLAGPLPGILLAGALLVTSVTHPGLLPSYTWILTTTMLLLNLFNLLPLGNLDGGQFLQATLFTRFPRAELVFRVGGSLLLAYFGLKSDMPLLAAFAALPLLSVRIQWDCARLRVAMARRSVVSGIPGDLQEATRRVDELLESPEFVEIPALRKGQVRQIVVKDLDPTPMPVWQSIAFVLLYLALWSPVILLLLGSAWMDSIQGR